MTTSRTTRQLRGTTILSRNFVPLAVVVAGLVAGAAPAHAVDDLALPTGGSVAAGSASFEYTPGQLNITQGTQNTVIDWASFNIGAGAGTEFFQPNTSAVAVNRIHDAAPSQILGTLRANGQIVLLNSNGVFFGRNATVDVGGLLASTGQLDEGLFTSTGHIALTDIDTGGKIENQGTISVRDAGLAAFVAPEIVNSGVINARLGKIALAAGGDRATVDLYGDGLVELALDAPTSRALIDNSGQISAQGGKIAITAGAARQVADSVINLGGVTEATSFSTQGGTIVLGGAGKVNVTGKIDASGKTGGGKIDVRGADIAVADTAKVTADATDTGNGGEIVFFAGKDAIYEGAFTARGGVNGGDGGFVELSAKDRVAYAGSVSTFAALGTSGQFLIDPLTATIHSGPLNTLAGDDYVLSALSLANDIALNGSVTVQADNWIDVGTDLIGVNIGNDLIDLANYSYNFGPVNFSGITSGNLTLDSAVVNFKRDLIMGTGQVNVQAPVVNLNARLYTDDGITTTLLTQPKIISNAGTVNVQSNNALIQQGIFLANTAGTVNVAAGTYNESVNVAKRVTLQGAKVGVAGKDITRGVGETIISPNSPGFFVTAHDVIIDGFTITGADNGIRVSGGNRAILRNNIIDDSTQNGIRIFNSVGSEVRNNWITDSGMDGVFATSNNGLLVIGNTVERTRDDGIDVEGTGGVLQIVGNTVDTTGIGLGAVGDQGNGIELTGSNGGLIQNNLVTNAHWDGIQVGTSTGVRVLNNTVDTTKFNAGIDITGNSLNTLVQSNTISNTKRHGITAFQTTNSRLLANNITNAGADGITAVGNANLEIGNNVIDTTKDDGIESRDTAGWSQIYGNQIYFAGFGSAPGAQANGIEINGSTGAQVTGNYVYYAFRDGIQTNNTLNAYIGGNTVEGTYENAGINIRLGSKGTTVENNNVSFTKMNGIGVHGTENTNIFGNYVSDAGRDGIYTSSNVNVVVDGNTVLYSRDDGIDVEGTTGITQITNNYVDTTGVGITPGADENNGIELTGSIEAVIASNQVYNAATDGIYHGDSNGTWIYNNWVENTRDRTGINVTVLSKNTLVENNTILNTKRHGITAFQTENTMLFGNSIFDTGADGVIGVTNTGLVIDSNLIERAGNDGIDITASNGAQILFNTIDDATLVGIKIASSSNVDVIDNIVDADLLGLQLAGGANDTAALAETLLQNNSFTSRGNGALFESGNVNFAGVNTFNFVGDGLVFNPATGITGPLAVVGDTFGTTVLNDANGAGFFINLQDGALFNPGTPTILDARFVTFNDGIVFFNFVPGTFLQPLPTYTALEARFNDFDDDTTLGQIFFTFPLAPDINDIFQTQQLGRFLSPQGGAVTILGFPGITPGAGLAGLLAGIAPNAGGPEDLNNIAPAAGGDDPQALNAIAPASGGDQASCWGQVYNHMAGAGATPVTYNMDNTPQGLLNDQAACAEAGAGTAL